MRFKGLIQIFIIFWILENFLFLNYSFGAILIKFKLNMRLFLKKPHLLILTFLSGIFFMACSEDKEEVEKAIVTTTSPTAEYEVENFIYRGMSDVYLYKKDVAVLADNYFSNQT